MMCHQYFTMLQTDATLQVRVAALLRRVCYQPGQRLWSAHVDEAVSELKQVDEGILVFREAITSSPQSSQKISGYGKYCSQQRQDPRIQRSQLMFLFSLLLISFWHLFLRKNHPADVFPCQNKHDLRYQG